MATEGDVATLLGVEPGSLVTIRRRVMLLDDVPVQLADSYYPADLAHGTPLVESEKIPGGTVAALERLGLELGDTELGELCLVTDATADVRVHRAAPLFKLYLINNEEAFFGFYPVREHIISLGGEPRAIYDVMGKDAILFHHTTTDDDTSTGSQYVEQARTWFDSVWTTIATEFTR